MASNFKNDLKKLCLKGALPTRKTIEKRLDKLWRDGIKEIQSARLGSRKCAVPKCNLEGTNSHHIIPKGRCKGLRWVLKNGINLCVSHHVFGNFSAHNPPLNDPDWFRREVLLKYHTQADLDKLQIRSYGTFRVSVSDLILLEMDLAREIESEVIRYTKDRQR